MIESAIKSKQEEKQEKLQELLETLQNENLSLKEQLAKTGTMLESQDKIQQQVAVSTNNMTRFLVQW